VLSGTNSLSALGIVLIYPLYLDDNEEFGQLISNIGQVAFQL
jgi:hypothetical protein